MKRSRESASQWLFIIQSHLNYAVYSHGRMHNPSEFLLQWVMECLIQIQPSIVTLQYHFCLEWLLNNAFTLTTYYLWYIVSHCCFSLLEYYQQRICVTLLTIMIIDAKLLCFIHVYDLSWNGLDMCSKLWSKCLPFRASLSAILSAFSWHFCLVGLSVYSYPGLEAHVCDGLSG